MVNCTVGGRLSLFKAIWFRYFSCTSMRSLSSPIMVVENEQMPHLHWKKNALVPVARFYP